MTALIATFSTWLSFVGRHVGDDILRVARPHVEHLDAAGRHRWDEGEAVGVAAVEQRLDRILELADLELAFRDAAFPGGPGRREP